MRTIAASVARLQKTAAASPDLLQRGRAYDPARPLAGHCYVVCEALAALHPDLKPCVVRHEGGTHWFMRRRCGAVVDPTAAQFATPVPYDRGRGCGFLTAAPSRRAAALLRRAGFRG